MAKTGRKPKLTQEMQEAICRIIALPCTIRTALEYVNVSESAFHVWCQKGAKGVRPYKQFLEAVTRARSQGKLRIARDILQGDDVRVKLEYLSRVYPSEFGKTEDRRLPEGEGADKASIGIFINGRDGRPLTLAEIVEAGRFPRQEALPASMPALALSNGEQAEGEDNDGELLEYGPMGNSFPRFKTT